MEMTLSPISSAPRATDGGKASGASARRARAPGLFLQWASRMRSGGLAMLGVVAAVTLFPVTEGGEARAQGLEDQVQGAEDRTQGAEDQELEAMIQRAIENRHPPEGE